MLAIFPYEDVVFSCDGAMEPAEMRLGVGADGGGAVAAGACADVVDPDAIDSDAKVRERLGARWDTSGTFAERNDRRCISRVNYDSLTL
mmetsp:Transcript_6900/g.9140  ORF Transcript_6900/g.9140 Transcript_6900/m.9140 type:complete len:89 (-) Transcript_6900:22-288(-)